MHYSPQVALLQCIVSVFLTTFFLHHTWHYDRFATLNFFQAGRAGRSREAFKRVMVILYIIGSPAFAVQGGVYAWIKYEHGFLPLALSGMPVPYEFWPARHQRLILPLQYINAAAWTTELIVHLEELMFFLHLIELEPSSPPWFESTYFKIVCIGAVFSLLGTFGPVALYSNDPLKAEAVLYLIGSSFILLSNFLFFKVFWAFPGFLANLKLAGGNSEVVIRLKAFHELNKIRVAARFTFGVPLFILSVDGLTSKKLNHSLAWTDILLLTGLIGFSIQATATLLIFFPRNIAKEAGVLRQLSFPSGYSTSSPTPSVNPSSLKPSYPPLQHPYTNGQLSPAPFTTHSSLSPALTTLPPPPARRPSLPLSNNHHHSSSTESIEKLNESFSFGHTPGRVFVLPPGMNASGGMGRRNSLPGPGGSGSGEGSSSSSSKEIPRAVREFRSPIDII